METGIMESITAINLATCPPEVAALDTNATALWPVLLRKVGVTISKGEHIEDKRAWLLRNFGVDDLTNRLAVQQTREHGGPQDDLARARIWRHIAEASSPGETISDLTEKTLYTLNPFIVAKAKRFASPLDAFRQQADTQAKPDLPPCGNPNCPDGATALSTRAKFCSKSCRNMASEQRQWGAEPPRAIRPKRSDATHETPADRQKAYRNRKSQSCVTDNEALEAA